MLGLGQQVLRFDFLSPGQIVNDLGFQTERIDKLILVVIALFETKRVLGIFAAAENELQSKQGIVRNYGLCIMREIHVLRLAIQTEILSGHPKTGHLWPLRDGD
jgi:hypothetical protein